MKSTSVGSCLRAARRRRASSLRALKEERAFAVWPRRPSLLLRVVQSSLEAAERWAAMVGGGTAVFRERTVDMVEEEDA